MPFHSILGIGKDTMSITTTNKAIESRVIYDDKNYYGCGLNSSVIVVELDILGFDLSPPKYLKFETLEDCQVLSGVVQKRQFDFNTIEYSSLNNPKLVSAPIDTSSIDFNIGIYSDKKYYDVDSASIENSILVIVFREIKAKSHIEVRNS